jgi:hypothetical protein
VMESTGGGPPFVNLSKTIHVQKVIKNISLKRNHPLSKKTPMCIL